MYAAIVDEAMSDFRMLASDPFEDIQRITKSFIALLCMSDG